MSFLCFSDNQYWRKFPVLTVSLSYTKDVSLPGFN